MRVHIIGKMHRMFCGPVQEPGLQKSPFASEISLESAATLTGVAG